MQIRQLESLQQMAKSSGSKVIFVPMNLSDLNSAVAGSSSKQGATMSTDDVSKIAQLSSL